MSRRKKSRAVQRAEYALYRLVASLARRLSDGGIHRWGDRLGDLARRILGSRDRLAMRNLRMAFPSKGESELRQILDSCWRHFGREALDAIRMQDMSLEEVAARCPMVNAHHLEEAIARGDGVILISAHYGGWEVGGLALMSLVKNVRTVFRPLDNEFLERDLARIRSRTGAEVLDRKRAAREMMKALSENAVVVLLPDQAVLPREGVLVPFFGRKAWTTPVPAKIADRRGSTIVFAFCIPHETGHRLEFENPIRVDQLSAAERDPVMLTARINDVISQRIADHPELWLWMHDRWKGTATGESEGVNGQ
jgi:KDO2-lipid IV(A) lauroyltransferase